MILPSAQKAENQHGHVGNQIQIEIRIEVEYPFP